MIYLRSAIFSIGFFTSTVFYATFSVIFLRFLPFEPRFKGVTLANRFYIWWLGVCCGIKYEIEGADNLPASGSYVILANHQSEWETIFFQVMVSPLCTVLKKELLRVPFFGWALALLDPIAIDRSERTNALKQILKQGRSRLKEGVPVLIFPQGTRIQTGEIGKFNKGGAMLACAAKAKVVPIVHNAGEHWPGKGFLKYPGVIKVMIGPVVETVGRSVDEVHVESKNWMEAKMLEMQTLETGTSSV